MKYNKIFLFLFNYFIFQLSFVKSQCPLDPNWRPTPTASNPIQSSPISTIQAASDIVYGASDLFYKAFWGVTDNSITSSVAGGSDKIVSVNFDPWAPDYFYIASAQSAPALKANVSYQFSFDFKLGQPLSFDNDYSNMTLSFYMPNDHNYFFWSYRAPIYAKTFTGDFSSSSEYKTTIVNFSLPFDLGHSRLFLQVNRTRATDYNPTNILFKNMKFTVLPKSVSTPPNLVTKDSELIVIPKPSNQLDPQDSTTCPYLGSDIVHWHDPSVWGGSVPLPSSIITLPTNKKILISPCSINQVEVYKKIIIPVTSELIFADANLTMNVQDIYVQGKLIMGTKTCRYNSFINIVFNGQKTLNDSIAPFYGSKGIAVAKNGFISVQGKQYHYTWTKLATTVWSGDRIIWIQDNVNWEVGQKVLITTSIYEDENDNQNEVMTIKAIIGKVIEFTEPLKFYHYGGSEYQAEVALLSRRIIFQGDESSEQELFGGHVLVNGEGQFSGIQLIRMGQQNVKARYPLHYHLAGVVHNSYISDCSVTNSYYRCYTIHGTNNVTLTRNVAFNAFGNCYYLEDGVEMDNTLSYNLGAFIHTIGEPASGGAQTGETIIQNSNLTQPADRASGVYYITNGWNTIIGNSASGGWTGFSFPNLNKPIGNHQDVDMEPKAFPNKVFEGNTAHSTGYQFITGSAIYVGGNLEVDSTTGLLVYNTGRFSRATSVDGISSWDPATFLFQRFNNTKIYLTNIGINQWGERVEVIGLEAYDSNRPAQLFGSAWLSNAIVNAQSGNILSKSNEYYRLGFTFYDTYTQSLLTNIVYRNFIQNPTSIYPDEDNVVITGLTFSDVYKPQYISATKNITLQNVQSSQIIGHEIQQDSGSSRFFNFIDWDGSTVGKNGIPSIIGSHENWYNYDSQKCYYNNDWNVWVCDKGNKTVVNVEFWIPGLVDPGVNFEGDSFIGCVSLFGNGITDIRKTNITRNAGATGISDSGWLLYLDQGTPSYINIFVSQVAYGHYIYLAVQYPPGTTFNIYTENKWAWENYKGFNCTLATSAEQVRSGNGTLYYFDGTHLFIKVINNALTGDDSEYFIRDGVKIEYTYWEYHYHIHSSNSNIQTVDGYYKNLIYTLPSPNL